jgi:hypothetical protein
MEVVGEFEQESGNGNLAQLLGELECCPAPVPTSYLCVVPSS